MNISVGPSCRRIRTHISFFIANRRFVLLVEEMNNVVSSVKNVKQRKIEKKGEKGRE